MFSILSLDILVTHISNLSSRREKYFVAVGSNTYLYSVGKNVPFL